MRNTIAWIFFLPFLTYAQFAPFSSDVRTVDRNFFELSCVIQATSSGGNKPWLEQKLASPYWQQRTDIFGRLPRLLESYSLYGKDSAFAQADLLRNNGFSETDILYTKLAMSSFNKCESDATEYAEKLRKKEPEHFLSLYTEVNAFLSRNIFARMMEDEQTQELHRRVKEMLSNSANSNEQRVYLRLALCDLEEALDSDYAGGMAVVDSLWKIHPQLMVPEIAEQILSRDENLYQASLATIRQAITSDKEKEISLRTLELLFSPSMDYTNPVELRKLIASAVSQKDKELIRVLALFHARDNQDFSLIRQPSLFGLRKEETRRFSEAVRKEFTGTYSLHQWNQLASGILGQTVDISEAQFNSVMEKAPDGTDRKEMLVLLYGGMIYELTYAWYLENRTAWVMNEFGKQQKPSTADLKDWKSYLTFLHSNPFYESGLEIMEINELFRETTVAGNPGLFFDDASALLSALHDLQEMEKRYPASIATKRNILSLISMNTVGGNLEKNEEVVQIYALTFTDLACRGAIEERSRKLFNYLPYDFKLYKYEEGSTIFDVLTKEQLSSVKKLLKKAGEENTFARDLAEDLNN